MQSLKHKNQESGQEKSFLKKVKKKGDDSKKCKFYLTNDSLEEKTAMESLQKHILKLVSEESHLKKELTMLRKQKEEYRTLFETINHGIQEIDAKGNPRPHRSSPVWGNTRC